MPHAELFLTDREFAVLLTITITVVFFGGWLAVVRTLQQIRRAAEILLKRTELLSEHIDAALDMQGRVGKADPVFGVVLTKGDEL